MPVSPLQRAAQEWVGAQQPVVSNVDSNINKDWRAKFIGALMQGASVRKAARIAGVDVTTPYKRRVEDKEFERAWREAAEIKTELLAQEAQRRAYHGVIKPVFYKGQLCGHERRYSDLLMIFELKKRDPTYRDGLENALGGLITFNINVVNVESNDQASAPAGLPAIDVQVVDVNGSQNGKQDHQGLSEAAPVLPE